MSPLKGVMYAVIFVIAIYVVINLPLDVLQKTICLFVAVVIFLLFFLDEVLSD